MAHTIRQKDNSFKTLLSMLYSRHHCGYGLVILLVTLLGVAILAGINFDNRPSIFVAGSIADADVVAHRNLLVEDVLATNIRREQMRQSQPLVFDLNHDAYEQFNTKIISILNEVNGSFSEDDYTALRDFEDIVTPQVAEEVIVQLSHPSVQTYILNSLLPNIRQILEKGIVSDIRNARVGQSGAIIHDLKTGAETLRPDIINLPNVQSTLIQLNSVLRDDKTLNSAEQRALIVLISALMPASLTLNTVSTNARADAAAVEVAPVYYQLQRGEVVVRKGELVTREQQTMLQTIYSSAAAWIHGRLTIGLFILSVIISLGLFMSPSGKPSTPLLCKDHILMSLLLACTALGAKIIYVFAYQTGEAVKITSLSYAFPVAGIVGLVAMVFAARRYCTMGILLALFTTVMFKSDITLFFFHFLGGMLATWLVTRAQTRQDVVWSIIPLSIGQVLFWFAATTFAQTPITYYPVQLLYVIGNSILSLCILFAFSPVLELAFGYTTRFRLMELMSLEQPLMQEMMVTMPGTYHHSLVVANMVEAGAKVIGANSLLCKVGALYHDVGKLQHPDYFIENQFGGRNKHDKLAPSMSALILSSHIKRGIELAESYRLGKEICDLIQQHHGTRLMQFFYQKAITLGENPQESEFCYGGPRPQTKEAAILMLADSVEASSRTLNDPTPARLQGHIDKIVKGIFSEGQLDESELIFKDLHKISEQFLRILTGIFHQRIAYPAGTQKDINKPQAEENRPKNSSLDAVDEDDVNPLNSTAISLMGRRVQ